MTTTIRDINELQDRRIMMEKKLPPFGYALILLTAALILFLVVWSTKNYRTYVSQSSGSVQAANKTYIMSSYSGSITELNIAEGTYVNEGDLIAHIKSTDLDMQQDSIQSQLDIYKKQKSQYEKLVKSIQDDKNYFSETDIDDQPYYYQYETYKSQVAQKAFDASPYQAAGYSDEQIKALMEQNQSEVEALYYSTLQSISASLTSVQSNIDNLQSQMDALSTGANDYYIYAPTSGVIHMDTPYKVGMVLSAGTPLATVASENSDLEVVAYVTLSDRPLLHVGDPCKIAITGLSEYSYGTLTGTVTSIDSDVTASSSDPAVATVNNFGKVTGVAPGTATITATCGDVSASATVKVVNSGVDRQSIDLNTSYVVLKPGASRTITGKVTPSSASQSLTFKSNDTKVATVSAKGVITAVGTGATSIVVSNGTASASVTVIVNRNASSSGNGGGSTDGNNGEVITDPVVEAIEADGTDEVTFAQREVPIITGEMLNALRLNGKTLVVEADNYTIRIAGRDVKNTSAQVSTALSFAPSEYGVTFTLNGGEALPGVVQVEMTGDNAAYTRIYLHNAVKGKWQFLNSYKDNVLEADTAGEYLLTTQNLRFAHVDMTFFIAGLVVIVGIIIAYIVIKKRYWFW